MTRKERLEKKQAEAEAEAKKARKELAKINREEKRKAEQEAAKEEQEAALAFYREFGKFTKQELSVWIGIIEEAKMQTIMVPDKDGNPASRVVYDWLKSCYTKRLKSEFSDSH